MRIVHCFAIAAAVSVSLMAQSYGRLAGKVTNTEEKPIPNATIVMKRFDMNWSREIKVGKDGKFSYSGLDPKEYEFTLSAEGYVAHKEMIKIPLGEVLTKNIVLKTPEETIASVGTAVPAGAAKANEGDTAFIEGVGFFNDKSFSEAIPKFENAIAFYKESISTLKEASMVEDAERFMAIAINSLAISQFEVGKTTDDQRNELWQKAEPVLKANFDKLGSDDKSQERLRLAAQLYEIASMKGDDSSGKMYLGVMEAIEGPKAENSYNVAVDLFNVGNLAGAKPHLKRAIEINPDFPETYYLLGYCELSDGNIPAAKASFQKYLKLAPDGKYAAEVKQNLAELR
jgi:tetratricopeptide (TPR) repeat protein